MKFIAVIPGRYDATRFPGKLMKDLGGKTVIRTTYENTIKTGLFEEVFVATDSDVIYDEIREMGGNAVKSQKEHATGSDRIAEAVRDLEFDVVVNVQGDEPFINKTALKGLIQAFKEDENHEISVATLAQRIEDKEDFTNPNIVKVNWDINQFALYFSRNLIPYPREKEFQATYYRHIGVYAFRKEALMKFTGLPMRQNEKAEKLEQLRYLEYGMRIKIVETDFRGIGIDTPEDLVKAREYLKKLNERN